MTPIPTLGDCGTGICSEIQLIVKLIVTGRDEPYSSYPKDNINLCPTCAWGSSLYQAQVCETIPYLGVLIYSKTLFLRTIRETITRQTERNHMEANFIRSTLCQQRKNLPNFIEAAGPCIREGVK